MKHGDTFRLRALPDLQLRVVAVYPDGNVKGVLSVLGVGVVGTIKLRAHRVPDQWAPSRSKNKLQA